jgi:hypothetical protein
MEAQRCRSMSARVKSGDVDALAEPLPRARSMGRERLQTDEPRVTSYLDERRSENGPSSPAANRAAAEI